MRLINADALEREGWSLCRTFRKDKGTMVYEMKKPSDFPTIEERKKGRLVNPTPYGECFECGCLIDSREGYNFCPNCGADMRGEEA